MSGAESDVQRMAARLRMAADEIESAARYGVPIPYCINVDGHRFGGASFSATEAEFAAWSEYTEADVERYEHNGRDWSRVDRVDVNGLPLSFAVQHSAQEAAS